MTNSTKTPSKNKLCPVCGTRLSENAARCLVCGSDLTAATPARPEKAVQGTRMPEITLSLPAALGLLALFVAIGAITVYLITPKLPEPNTPAAATVIAQSIPTLTPTVTPTITLTPTETATPTLEPTYTPLPPIEYKVKANDTCGSIAAFFNVSVRSIVLLNDLPTECPLSIDKVIKVPQPTPTASPQPTRTLNAAEATEAACQKVDHVVKAGDTLSTIAALYGVNSKSIKAYNALSSDSVLEGQTLHIPLCERAATPGPTPTATPMPPYPPVNLLMPQDGASFTLANDSITLQWASAGNLQKNEAYAVTIEDVTEGSGQKTVEYVTDTKFTLTSAFRPTSNTPHIFRWWVFPVRQVGTDPNSGAPIWEPAGEVSAQRVFGWSGAGQSSTPAP
ncbi:MAG TPA: LysM peptidoglycan-binding domain-containing protein [Anaerolineaceae bacterium]|nr:LysM peptidoglycan-binding domain-containing protein [Anaerolineaceae bacterium]HPN52857.1 LysM peptidoglycan-binding domain-containing protein [Anaerolineaceae bacterium]